MVIKSGAFLLGSMLFLGCGGNSDTMITPLAEVEFHTGPLITIEIPAIVGEVPCFEEESASGAVTTC